MPKSHQLKELRERSFGSIDGKSGEHLRNLRRKDWNQIKRELITMWRIVKQVRAEAVVAV